VIVTYSVMFVMMILHLLLVTMALPLMETVLFVFHVLTIVMIVTLMVLVMVVL